MGYEWYNIEADYKIPHIEEKWKRDSSFFTALIGSEFTILPFIRFGGEYNRVGDEDIWGIGLRIGL